MAGALCRIASRLLLISEGLRSTLLGWVHSGFSVHNQVRVADAPGRASLAAYMRRAPFALEKMTYDPPTGNVVYRSRMHATLKRNFQLMPGAEWLELLLRHNPGPLRAPGALRGLVLQPRAASGRR